MRKIIHCHSVSLLVCCQNLKQCNFFTAKQSKRMPHNLAWHFDPLCESFAIQWYGIGDATMLKESVTASRWPANPFVGYWLATTSLSNQPSRREAFSGIVATPTTSCIFRLALFGIPTDMALMLAECDPTVVGGLLPHGRPLPFYMSRLHCVRHNVGKPAYKGHAYTVALKFV